MDATLRKQFDEQLDRVMAGLPRRINELLDHVPLIVEDYPSRKWLHQLGETHREDLCGLYVGVSLADQGVDQTSHPTPVVYLFREGIIATTIDEAGELTDDELRRQIRLTILHEYGHHHGMDEDELEELGY